MKVSDIARAVGGEWTGGADPDLRGIAPLDRADAADLSFLAHPRYLPYLPATRAGALLIAASLAERVPPAVPCIVVDDVHRALAALLPALYPQPSVAPGVHPTAVLGRGVVLGVAVTVGPYAVIEAGAEIGERARIGAHCAIGAGSRVEEDVVLHPHVTLYAGTRVGARSIIHAGARLGVDGFGYANVDGRARKIPQVGGCVIGEDVEIGANTTIDRGSIGATEIGAGVKIDNLVHIAHNVRIGEGSIIVAQVGVAGSTVIGRGVTLAGQAGLAGHIEIGDGTTIGAQAGVFGDVPAGVLYSGYPARPHRESLRAQASLARLPKLVERLRALERAVFGGGASEP